MYLLDTNVVSELRRIRPHGAVIAWLRDVADADIYLSVVTIGELQAGVEITREQDAAKADEIEQWLDRLTESHNILPIDAPIYRRWAQLMHRKPDRLNEDAMIAATAQVHRLTVATRNVRDFAAFNIHTLNPFLNNRVR